jgi:hypothetical protein
MVRRRSGLAPDCFVGGVTRDAMEPSDARTQVAAYYRNPSVRARLREYCGDEDDRGPSAVFVGGLDPTNQPYPTWSNAAVVPTSDLDALAARGADLARSLWDSRALIFLLDLDYQNLDFPSEPFTHPTDVFFKLENLYASTQRVFQQFGLATLTTATGRGYHLVGRIPLVDPVLDALSALADLPSWHGTYLRNRPPGVRATMEACDATAAAGLGLVIEYLAHLILGEAEPLSLVPVVVNGTTVGSGFVGRECVSIDFSHVGDPMSVRHVRMGFSTYQWHRARPDIFGPEVAALPPIVALPRPQSSLEAFLLEGRDLHTGATMAVKASNALPDISAGVSRALESYRGSALAVFHSAFAAERRRGAAVRTDLPADLAPCLRRALDQPNDLLLKPEHVQNLVRGLMARGWTGSEIARVVEREYTRDHGWGDRWARLDARTRADFDVRVFAGLIVTGRDRLIDFNCKSSQDKAVCPFVGCAHDLREDRDRLWARFPS